MSSTTTTATTLDYIARGICLLMSSQCINSIINTRGGATQFLGLPTITPEALTFFPPLGARNAAIGLSTLALSLRGDRLGVATAFGCTCISGVVDAVVCWRRKGNWQVHALATGLLVVMSGLLVMAT